MRSLLIFLVFILAFGEVDAQCPGPSQRTNLINLQKSQSVEGTLAGQIPLSDNCGNLRYAQYTEAENTPLGFIPTATGNVSNFSEFVIASDSTRWYIDWQGRGYLLGPGGAEDRNGYYGGNFGNGGDNTIPSVTRSTLTNQLTFYRATDDIGGLVPIRIQVDAGNEPDFMSFRNLTDSMTIKRSDQDFEIRNSNGLSIFGNTSANPANGGISLFSNTADVIIDATGGGNLFATTSGEIYLEANTDAALYANTGNIDIAVSVAGYINISTPTVQVVLDDDFELPYQGTADAVIDDNSTTRRYLEYADIICDSVLSHPLSIPSVSCVAQLVSDSISGLIPPGTINQTLRYSATNVLQANSEIFNNGNQVAIGTTTFPSWSELHVLGDTRLDDQVFVGNAVGRQHTGAAIAVNDTTKTSVVYFANRWNNASGNMDLTLYARHVDAEARYHVISGGGEGQFNWGLGASQQFYFSTDGGGSLGTSRVYTITPPIGGSLTGNIGVQVDAPTARLHLAGAVDGEANSASLKFELGDELDTPEDGAVYFAPSSGTDDLRLNADGTSFVLAKSIIATAVIDFGSINQGASETSLAIVIAGVAVGDQVVLGYGAGTTVAGMYYNGYVSAANTVRIIANNISLAPIDPASATYTVRVFH